MEELKESGKKIKPKLFAVKVSSGHEIVTAMIAAEKYKSLKNVEIFSSLVLDEIKNYVLVEAINLADVSTLFYGIKFVRGHVRGMMEIKDVEHLILPKEKEIEIKEGNEVEVIWGPFKGSIAEVVSVNPSKKEVTIILKESLTPIPIQISIDYIRLIKK